MPDITISYGADPNSSTELRKGIEKALSDIALKISSNTLSQLNQQIQDKVQPKLTFSINGNAIRSLPKEIEGALRPINLTFAADTAQVQKLLEGINGKTVEIAFKSNASDIEKVSGALDKVTESFDKASKAKDAFSTSLSQKFPEILNQVKSVNAELERMNSLMVAAGKSSIKTEIKPKQSTRNSNVEKDETPKQEKPKRSRQAADDSEIIKKYERTIKSLETAQKEQTQALQRQREVLRNYRQDVADATKANNDFAERIGFSTARIAAYLIPAATFYKLGQAVNYAAQQAVLLNSEFNKLSQVLDNNDRRASSLSKNILASAAKSGQSTDDAFSVAKTLSQSPKFFKNDEAVSNAADAFSKTNLVEGFGDIKETVDGTIAAMSQFARQGLDVNRILDITARTTQTTGTATNELFEAIKTGGSTFQQAGGKIEQYAAIIGTLRQKTGLSTGQIGAGVNSIVEQLSKPDSLVFQERLVARSGGTIRDSAGQLKPIHDRLILLGNATKQFSQQELPLVISKLADIREARTFIPLLEELRQTNGQTNLLDNNLNKITNSAGAFDRAAGKGSETIEARLKQVVAVYQQSFLALAENKGIQNLVKDVADLAKAFASSLTYLTPFLSTLIKVGAIKLGVSVIKNLPSYVEGLGKFTHQGQLARNVPRPNIDDDGNVTGVPGDSGPPPRGGFFSRLFRRSGSKENVTSTPISSPTPQILEPKKTTDTISKISPEVKKPIITPAPSSVQKSGFLSPEEILRRNVAVTEASLPPTTSETTKEFDPTISQITGTPIPPIVNPKDVRRKTIITPYPNPLETGTTPRPDLARENLRNIPILGGRQYANEELRRRIAAKRRGSQSTSQRLGNILNGPESLTEEYQKRLNARKETVERTLTSFHSVPNRNELEQFLGNYRSIGTNIGQNEALAQNKNLTSSFFGINLGGGQANPNLEIEKEIARLESQRDEVQSTIKTGRGSNLPSVKKANQKRQDQIDAFNKKIEERKSTLNVKPPRTIGLPITSVANQEQQRQTTALARLYGNPSTDLATLRPFTITREPNLQLLPYGSTSNSLGQQASASSGPDPLTVYHASPNLFGQFDYSRLGKNTNTPEALAKHGRRSGDTALGAQFHPERGRVESYKDILNARYLYETEIAAKNIKEVPFTEVQKPFEEIAKLREQLLSQGYDAVRLTDPTGLLKGKNKLSEGSVAALDPSIVKVKRVFDLAQGGKVVSSPSSTLSGSGLTDPRRVGLSHQILNPYTSEIIPGLGKHIASDTEVVNPLGGFSRAGAITGNYLTTIKNGITTVNAPPHEYRTISDLETSPSHPGAVNFHGLDVVGSESDTENARHYRKTLAQNLRDYRRGAISGDQAFSNDADLISGIGGYPRNPDRPVRRLKVLNSPELIDPEAGGLQHLLSGFDPDSIRPEPTKEDLLSRHRSISEYISNLRNNPNTNALGRSEIESQEKELAEIQATLSSGKHQGGHGSRSLGSQPFEGHSFKDLAGGFEPEIVNPQVARQRREQQIAEHFAELRELESSPSTLARVREQHLTGRIEALTAENGPRKVSLTGNILENQFTRSNLGLYNQSITLDTVPFEGRPPRERVNTGLNFQGARDAILAAYPSPPQEAPKEFTPYGPTKPPKIIPGLLEAEQLRIDQRRQRAYYKENEDREVGLQSRQRAASFHIKPPTYLEELQARSFDLTDQKIAAQSNVNKILKSSGLIVPQAGLHGVNFNASEEIQKKQLSQALEKYTYDLRLAGKSTEEIAAEQVRLKDAIRNELLDIQKLSVQEKQLSAALEADVLQREQGHVERLNKKQGFLERLTEGPLESLGSGEFRLGHGGHEGGSTGRAIHGESGLSSLSSKIGGSIFNKRTGLAALEFASSASQFVLPLAFEKFASGEESRIQKSTEESGELTPDYIDRLRENKAARANQQALSGAGTGAAIGGAVGSFIPVIGTLIGGVAGALVGSVIGKISGKSHREQENYNDLFKSASAGLTPEKSAPGSLGLINEVIENNGIDRKKVDLSSLTTSSSYNTLKEELGKQFDTDEGKADLSNIQNQSKVIAADLTKSGVDPANLFKETQKALTQRYIAAHQEQNAKLDPKDQQGDLALRINTTGYIDEALKKSGKIFEESFVGFGKSILEGVSHTNALNLALSKLTPNIEQFGYNIELQSRKLNSDTNQTRTTIELQNQAQGALSGKGNFGFQLPENLAQTLNESFQAQVKNIDFAGNRNGRLQVGQSISEKFGSFLSPDQQAVYSDTAALQGLATKASSGILGRISSLPESLTSGDSSVLRPELEKIFNEEFGNKFNVQQNLRTPEGQDAFKSFRRDFVNQLGSSESFKRNPGQAAAQFLKGFGEGKPFEQLIDSAFKKLQAEIDLTSAAYSRNREVVERNSQLEIQGIGIGTSQAKFLENLGENPLQTVGRLGGIISNAQTGPNISDLSKNVVTSQNRYYSAVADYDGTLAKKIAPSQAQTRERAQATDELKNSFDLFNDGLNKSNAILATTRAKFEELNKVVSGMIETDKGVSATPVNDLSFNKIELQSILQTFGPQLQFLASKGVTNERGLANLSRSEFKNLLTEDRGLADNPFIQKSLQDAGQRFGGLQLPGGVDGQTVGQGVGLLQTLLGQSRVQDIQNPDEAYDLIQEQKRTGDQTISVENQQLQELKNINQGLREAFAHLGYIGSPPSPIANALTGILPTNTSPTGPIVNTGGTNNPANTPNVPGNSNNGNNTVPQTPNFTPNNTQNIALPVPTHVAPDAAHNNEISKSIISAVGNLEGAISDHNSSMNDFISAMHKLAVDLGAGKSDQSNIKFEGNFNVTGFDAVGKDAATAGMVIKILEALSAQLDSSNPGEASLKQAISAAILQVLASLNKK